MEIKYSSKKLEKTVSSTKEIQKNYGTMAKKVKQRLDEIRASENVSVLQTIPAARCHELVGNRKGQFSISISGNHRILFVPDEDSKFVNENGELDYKRITIIKIIGIGEDYH